MDRTIYVPGVFRCPKCSFRLIQSNLNPVDGTVTPRDTPGEKCPNDGAPMWRVTYREELAEAHEQWEVQVARAVAAEAKCTDLAQRLESADAAHQRQQDHLETHHRYFDELHHRALTEPGEFAAWVAAMTHPNPAMREG